MKKHPKPKFIVFQKHITAEKSRFKTESEWLALLKENRIAINPEAVCKVFAMHDFKDTLEAKYRTSSYNRVGITTTDGWQAVEVDGTLEEVLAALSL